MSGLTPSAAPRGRLVRKYVVVLLVLVGGVLMLSSLVELYFAYQETKRAIIREELQAAYANAGLFTIEGDGSLYEVKTTDGTWKNVGKPELWKGSKAGTIIGESDTLYVVNDQGVLQWSVLAAGDDVKPLPMGKPLYKNTKFLFVGHDGPMPTLYCLDSDGSLYAIEMAPMAG